MDGFLSWMLPGGSVGNSIRKGNYPIVEAQLQNAAMELRTLARVFEKKNFGHDFGVLLQYY